jgi:hypothetical protein
VSVHHNQKSSVVKEKKKREKRRAKEREKEREVGDGLYSMCSSQIHRHKTLKREKEKETTKRIVMYTVFLCAFILSFIIINQCNESGLNKDISIHLLSPITSLSSFLYIRKVYVYIHTIFLLELIIIITNFYTEIKRPKKTSFFLLLYCCCYRCCRTICC